MHDKSGCFLTGYCGSAGGSSKDEHNIAALLAAIQREAIETPMDHAQCKR